MAEPTDDQLRAAWHDLAMPDWGDFDQVARAARHWALVRLRATLIARGVRLDAPPAVHPPAAAAPAEPPPPAFWGSLRAPHGPMLDNKRAAAGERDDD